MHIGDLPMEEVEDIVSKSCGIPPKFGAMLVSESSFCIVLHECIFIIGQVSTMKNLQLHRQQSSLFQGRYGAVTMRDLIKWGHRQSHDLLTLADDGYMLLGEKLKREDEKLMVANVLEKVRCTKPPSNMCRWLDLICSFYHFV